VVKDPDLSLFDGGNGGGGGSGGAAETAAPATGAGAAAATGGGGGGGGGGTPAWTKSLNTTLGSLQSSIEELTAGAIAGAVDGSTLTLRGDLTLDGDVATMSDVEATLRESSRREGRRARDLGRGGGIR
jgi:hypothetical protein